MNRTVTFASLLLLLGCISYGFKEKKNTTEPSSILFTTDIAEDATPAVLQRVLRAGEAPVQEIRFEKGTYHFYPDKAYELFCHISNHDDVLTRTAFPLLNLQNLTIDGQGATFIFHGRMIPFIIENSRNINIRNLSIDWENSFHSEGRVVARDDTSGTFDLEISDEYPYVIRNEQLVFIKEYYEHTIGQSILYDPERQAIAFDTEAYTPLTNYSKVPVARNIDRVQYKYKIDERSPLQSRLGTQFRLKVEELKPGLVRIHHHGKKLPPIGTILVGKGEKFENRTSPAIRLKETADFHAENVTVHHAGGMGLIAENCSDLTLDRFNVTPSRGRMVSVTADATHFVNCRGKVILRNCTFNNQLDDATNVHGAYQEVFEILDEHTLGVRIGHAQQLGLTIGQPGDTLGLIRLSDSFFPYHKVTIQNIQPVNGRYHLIRVNETLPKKLEVGDLIENLDNYPELLVENCTISRNRARGLLISTPKRTVIRNNFFHTEMEAILIPVESSHWFESGNATNVLIENNVFQDCQHSGFDRGVIRFVTDDDNENIAFRNIDIRNNEFHHFDNLILEVANTSGLTFSGNTITYSGNFRPLHPQNPAITIKSSDAIAFQKNSYQARAKRVLQTDAALPNLHFE